MLYYFDETADQGYVDKASSLNEYGVLAGWAFPDRNKDVFDAKLAPILSSLSSCDYKKLHCTEIFKDDANSDLRDDLYQLLINLEEYVIIHEGAYLLGIKQQEHSFNNIIKAYPSKTPDHIRLNKPRDRTRLYIELLTGVIVKLEECAVVEGESHVYMISDRVNKPIQKEAKKQLEYLSTSEHNVVAKAYDINAKRQINKTMKIENASPNTSTKIERIKDISFLEDVNPLSFVADFISFELLRHFRRKMNHESPIKFQSPDIIEGFPLKNKIAFIGDDYFTDLVYRPK